MRVCVCVCVHGDLGVTSAVKQRAEGDSLTMRQQKVTQEKLRCVCVCVLTLPSAPPTPFIHTIHLISQHVVVVRQ